MGRYLADTLGRGTGLAWKVMESDPADPAPGAVRLTTRNARPELGDEGYTLDVTEAGIVLTATGAKGLFRGLQTLLQLLPPGVLARSTADGPKPPWAVSCVRVEDQPRFAWRGLMVDTSRHFFTKEELLDFIDVMALHKMSTFHWHINDDNLTTRLANDIPNGLTVSIDTADWNQIITFLSAFHKVIKTVFAWILPGHERGPGRSGDRRNRRGHPTHTTLSC